MHCIENDIVEHIPLTLFIKKSFQKCNKNQYPAKYQGLNADLSLLNWVEEVFNSENRNDIYNNFTQKYPKLTEKHVPTKTVIVRPSDKPYTCFTYAAGNECD